MSALPCSLKDKDQIGHQYRSIWDSCQVAPLWDKNMDTGQMVSLSTYWLNTSNILLFCRLRRDILTTLPLEISSLWKNRDGSPCSEVLPLIFSYWIISGTVICLSSCSPCIHRGYWLLLCPPQGVISRIMTREALRKGKDYVNADLIVNWLIN